MDMTMDMRILLVDDEEDIRDVLGIYLMDMGYGVMTAENGEQALNLFLEHAPPIVLSDIKMPGMDGIELLRHIKEKSPDTEVIMITGHGDMDLAIKSLKYEATEFITKPINDDALEIALNRAQERISMKAQLREYTENLERMVEEKTRRLIQAERLAATGQTVAGLAHAIKNITGGLTGGMFVLEKGIELDNTTYLNQGWEMIQGNVDKIKNMALDLLNYAKDRVPDLRPHDPNAPAREVAALMAPRAEQYKIILKTEFNPDIGAAVMDPEAIHRCLLDLVTNAIDACADVRSQNKPGEVVLSTAEKNGWAVEYCVRDNGHGMDDATRQKVFQRFFSTKGSKGTGLGLMIAKKIVDEHKGEISVESREGTGTEVRVRVPVREPGNKIHG